VTPSLLIVPVDLQHPATVGLTISLALTGSAHTQASPSPDSESVISINTISQLEPSTVEIPLKTYLGEELFTCCIKKNIQWTLYGNYTLPRIQLFKF